MLTKALEGVRSVGGAKRCRYGGTAAARDRSPPCRYEPMLTKALKGVRSVGAAWCYGRVGAFWASSPRGRRPRRRGQRNSQSAAGRGIMTNHETSRNRRIFAALCALFSQQFFQIIHADLGPCLQCI